MEQLEKTFYYVACATGKKYILDEAQYALKSLIKTGVAVEDIHFMVNTEKDKKVISKCIPELKNIYVANIDLSIVKWKYMKGKRKFSFFKAASLNKFFPEPIQGRHMVFFDTDVLFFKNPYEFLVKYKDKTWFHHGKRCSHAAKKKTKGKELRPEDIDINNKKSLAIWVGLPAAYLMIKHGAKRLLLRRYCAGFYILHPDDHAKLTQTTYKYCKEIAGRFVNNAEVGDQKPMNAAISVLDIDVTGANKEDYPNYIDYFEHYYGGKKSSLDFQNRAKKLGLK